MKLYLNACHNDITWNKKNYLLHAAEKMGLGDVVVPYEHGEVDYVLNIEPFFNFVKGNKFTSIWEIDVMFDRAEMSVSNWVACDTVFVANSNLPDRMKSFHGELITMFQACEPDMHKRVPGHEKKYDFVFSGSMGLEVYDERARTIKVLREAGFSFCDHQKGHNPQEYVKRLNDARVQFIRSAVKKPFTSQVEQRFFECLAIGPVLKDYHPDLEHLGLEEGKDFFWYKDDEEMITKMGILIDDPAFAKKMADNGRRKALMYHTYQHRIVTILETIKEHQNE